MYAPPSLTPRQRRLVLIFSIAIALTRFLAVAHSLFDWDEALFSLGVREYDVAQHHPHPPGYPLFIAAAKGVHLLGVDELRSVQTIVVLGACFMFPALLWLAMELGFDFVTAFAGAGVYAFLPNVWIYGGTAFSDVPATVLAFAACALLLRGRRDARAFVWGAVVLGIAAGVRQSNLLIGMIPALLATWFQLRARRYRAVAAAILLGGTIVAVSYAGAALSSASVPAYLEAVRGQREYVRNVDSWHNPHRGPLFDAAVTFWVYPFRERDLLNGLCIAAAVSCVAALITRRVAPLLTAAVFAPLAVTSWLNLDINTASRYAIGYMAVHALLAVDGFRVVGRRRELQLLLSAAAVIVMMVWTWPALRIQRTTDSPPAAAMKWVAEHTPPSDVVYVHAGFAPHADYLLAGHQVRLFDSFDAIPLEDGDAWLIDWTLVNGARHFIRPRGSLWQILRRRSFETSLGRVGMLIRFGDGWYQEEGGVTAGWRWMGKESRALLPGFRGAGRLTMRLEAPSELGQPATADVYVNGRLLDRVPAAVETERSWIVPPQGRKENELRIVANATVVPARVRRSTDTRELGLRVSRLTWTPLP